MPGALRERGPPGSGSSGSRRREPPPGAAGIGSRREPPPGPGATGSDEDPPGAAAASGFRRRCAGHAPQLGPPPVAPVTAVAPPTSLGEFRHRRAGPAPGNPPLTPAAPPRPVGPALRVRPR
ncbi:uncharacterized protein [Pithys albifrons albifrons]|uniref:uncharacterized protein n=1 Tax=Pithys albifrons albifrons TaxID=3385563 RepID=UPI003A5CB0D9